MFKAVIFCRKLTVYEYYFPKANLQKCASILTASIVNEFSLSGE